MRHGSQTTSADVDLEFPLDVKLVIASTDGQNLNQSGDYLASRPHSPDSNTWVATCLSLQGGSSNSNARPRFVWFGRERDTPASAVHTDLAADLSIAKTGPASVSSGAQMTYTLTVTSNGPDTATNVTVTDVLLGSVSFVSASAGCNIAVTTATCTAATLANGASVAYTVTVVAPSSSASVTNTASVASNTADLFDANDSDTLVTTLPADLSLTFAAFVFFARRRRANAAR